MSLKYVQLATHWEVDEVLEIIDFIDHLRDRLFETYGEEIRQQIQQECRHEYITDEEQMNLDFDDQIPF